MTQTSALEILSALVAFDTTSRNTNLPLVDWVEAYLKPYGGACTRIMDADEPKANLFVTFGPADAAGYILSGHTDVVPVDGQDWTTDPFKLSVSGGRAYGRGTTDMKGFLACCLSAVPRIAAAKLKRPIHLAFSYDEEVGCTGVRSMLDWMGGRVTPPLGAFIGEPTSMQVVTGHKGAQRAEAAVRGKAVHSSLAPQGVNAVGWGARLVNHIHDTADALAANGPFDALYDVPHTTLHCGIFSGGVVSNIVPHEARLIFECRAIGGESAVAHLQSVMRYARDVLEPRMRINDPQAGFDFTLRPELPGLDTPADAEIVSLAKKLAGRNDHAKVAYGTEAGLFTSIAGVPSVVAGPGDIDQAHKPDEFIALSELEKCSGFIEKLIAHCESA